MPRLSPKLLLTVAIVLSVVTAGLIYTFLQKATEETTVRGEPVVVATKDIAGRTAITADMIKVINIPQEMIQPGAYKEITKAIGVLTRIPIMAGEQITDKRLAVEGKISGFVGSIPKDKRAFTIAVSDITGVGGFARAGDYVDIVITMDKGIAGENVSALLQQNVLVLATNRNENMDVNNKDKKETEKMAFITVAVTPDEAAKLALAEQKGKIHLALRPFQPLTSHLIIKNMTPEDLVGFYQKQENSTNPPVVKVENIVPTDVNIVPTGGIKVFRGTKAEIAPIN